jgi:hypothetical protein
MGPEYNPRRTYFLGGNVPENDLEIGPAGILTGAFLFVVLVVVFFSFFGVIAQAHTSAPSAIHQTR